MFTMQRFCRLFVLLYIVLLQVTDAVVTCGGFVTTSSNLAVVANSKLDYSFVKMHLFTDEGLLKYSTECAPNGYYFIPVYDVGSFYLQIEGPTGWAFEPDRVVVNVNDQEQGCSEDINFKFTGFSLAGNVLGTGADDCSNESSGPSGVKLTFYLVEGEKLTELKSVLSDNGKFGFSNVFPGKYKVVASHENYKLTKTEQIIDVAWGNVELPEPFIVTGYSITGKLENSGSPVKGVDVFLYSTKKKEVACNTPEPGSITPERSDVLLCASQSDEQGAFSFDGLPCGGYTVVPFYKRKTTTFDVSPVEASVSVLHGITAMPEPFQVVGFSASGRVVDRTSTGISGATITVNNVEKAVTDEHGYYTIDKVTTGNYSVQATKLHYFFHDIKNFNLSPSTSNLPEITVVKYHVCGRINSDKVKGASTVNLKNAQFELSTETDNEGHYCFEVVPSEYEISPVLTSAQKRQGILLSPPTRRVTVSNAPLLLVDFVQARVALYGSVKCVGPCDKVIKISLVSHSRDQESLTTYVDDKGRFTFPDIFPGQYKTTVHHDSWCWEQTSIDVNVEYVDVDNIEFVQSGYVLQSSLSHDITLKITHSEEDSPKSFSLKKGANKFCLAKKGVYKLVPESCYRFEQETYSYDTSSPIVLELQARDYKVNGLILVSSAPGFSSVTTIPVNVRQFAGDGTYQDEVDQVSAQFKRTAKRSSIEAVCKEGVTADCIDAVQGETEVRVYEYTYWAPPGGRFEITPPTSSDMSQSFMYYPHSMEVSLSRKSCPPSVKPFHGRPGLFMKGSVTPAVAGVEITVKSSSGTPFLTVKTKDDGSYSAGPLHDDEQYSVSAHSNGYHFKEDKTGHFRALKLGDIVVSTDVDGDESKPLEGVLLSLSGDSYRDNNETDAKGEKRFRGLFPGTYFLRPLLKEYKFEPASKSIQVTEAGTINVGFKAIRIAYSAYGSVFSLNMEPENSVLIEAIQALEKNVTDDGKPIYPRYEETVTNANGHYRLRGLLPNSKYNIRIKQGREGQTANNRIERSSPAVALVDVATSNLHDINFAAFRKLSKFDVTGHVEASDDWLESLEVVLTSESAPQTVLKVTPISKAFTFFEFSALPVNNYLIYARPRSSMSSLTHTFISVPTKVELQKHTHITVKFEANLKPASQEPTQGSFLSVVMAVVGVALFLYRNQVEDAFQAFQRKAIHRSVDDEKARNKKSNKAKFSSKRSAYK